MFAASLIGYMSGEVAGRDVDHDDDDDDDDDDEKGQWNRSIAPQTSYHHYVLLPVGINNSKAGFGELVRLVL